MLDRRLIQVALGVGAVVAIVAAAVIVAVPPRVAPVLIGLDAAPSPSSSPSVLVSASPSPSAPSSSPSATAGGSGGGSGSGGGGGGSAPGSGEWNCAGAGPTWGSGAKGTYTFQIAVETSVPVSVGDFESVVHEAYGDYRGWALGGGYRLTQVAGCNTASYTVYLASAWTAYSLCINGGVDIRVNGYPYTDCRAGSRVVINADRYLNGGTYGGLTNQLMIINHETGHRLGYGHVLCPGSGQLAPVMQQQTLGLQGCVPNSWPYPGAAAPPPPHRRPSPRRRPTPSPTPSPASRRRPRPRAGAGRSGPAPGRGRPARRCAGRWSPPRRAPSPWC